jgi:uncharacterized protein YndB with AHSA1/START domain
MLATPTSWDDHVGSSHFLHAANSASPSRGIRLTRHLRAHPRAVYDAWLDPAIAGSWLFATATRPMTHARIDARVGGAFHLVDVDSRGTTHYRGHYVELRAPQRLAFVLHIDPVLPMATNVRVALRATPRGCSLLLVHDDVPGARSAAMRQRWTGILFGLDVTLDAPFAQPAHRSTR